MSHIQHLHRSTSIWSLPPPPPCNLRHTAVLSSSHAAACSIFVRLQTRVQHVSQQRITSLVAHSAAFEMPTTQRQRHQQPQTETGGGGWGPGSGTKPPQGGSGGGGGSSKDDDGDDDEVPISNPFKRVVMRCSQQLEADPWFVWKVMATGLADVAAILIVTQCQSRHSPSSSDKEALASQVCIALLNTLAIAIIAQPFSGSTRRRIAIMQMEGGLLPAGAASVLSGRAAETLGGALPMMRLQALGYQALQLGIIGLLTGYVGSALARRVALKQDAAQDTSKSAQLKGRLLRIGLERMLFMAFSGQMRHVALYAAEDMLSRQVVGAYQEQAARGALHVANSMFGAWQWQRVSSRMYADV